MNNHLFTNRLYHPLVVESVKLDYIYLLLKLSIKTLKDLDYLMSLKIKSTLIPLDIMLGTTFLRLC